MTFLRELVEAYPQIENHGVRQCVCIVNVSPVIGPILKPLSYRSAVDVATLRVCGPVIPVFRVKAVVVLSKKLLLVAKPMVNASEPGAVFFMTNDIREVIVLRTVRGTGKIRQRVILEQGYGRLIE